MDLKQSKVTQVVNDVQIISAADQKEKTATVNDLFNMPDILRTGPASRAELVAADQTITRVGANTIFSFDPASRTIDLKQGSLLFHSPHGKGGGTIHTGSATASVLGTTLIIVATPDGGLKVITLEGEVEVKFLNGLKQKLNPGQMTFVLPGANQLAPVIVFRLDELTQNSLLIKGFTQPLSSLPLIQNQISQQLKLISSGKATDTGLDVADSATPNTVSVLDPNTITSEQHHQQSQQPQGTQTSPPNPPQPPPSGSQPDLAAAEAADATINQPSLTDASIPTPPQHVIVGQMFPVPGSIYFGRQNFSGFVARNIFVNTPPVETDTAHVNELNPLVVNMAPYAKELSFDFVAVNDFSIEGSVTFSGLGSGENFALIAGDQFVFTPGISIEADAHDFTLSSPAAMSFDNVTLNNNVLDINVNSGDTISFTDGSTVNAGGRFIASAANDITFSDSTLNSVSGLFTSLNGNIAVVNSTLNTSSHANFLAPKSISLSGSTINANTVSLVGTTLGSTIAIDNTVINAPGGITASSDGDINVTGSTQVPDSSSAKDVTLSGSELNADPNKGSVSLISASGAVNISGTSITAHTLTLSSGDGILLDARGHTVTAAGSGATANFTDNGANATARITVNNTDFSSFAVVNMAANTIVLCNDVLALVSNFGCQSGQANFGGSVVQGDVNFYHDKMPDGTPVTSSIVQYTSGPLSTSGLHVYPK